MDLGNKLEWRAAMPTEDTVVKIMTFTVSTPTKTHMHCFHTAAKTQNDEGLGGNATSGTVAIFAAVCCCGGGEGSFDALSFLGPRSLESRIAPTTATAPPATPAGIKEASACCVWDWDPFSGSWRSWLVLLCVHISLSL